MCLPLPVLLVFGERLGRRGLCAFPVPLLYHFNGGNGRLWG